MVLNHTDSTAETVPGCQAWNHDWHKL